MLKFYWELGRDIVSMDADNKYGSGFYKCLSNDLKEELPGVDGLSPSNLRYTKRFYLLYNELVGNFQQLAENLFSVPWGHHLFLIDKCSNAAKGNTRERTGHVIVSESVTYKGTTITLQNKIEVTQDIVGMVVRPRNWDESGEDLGGDAE